MNVTKKQERIIQDVLNGWEQRGDISAEEHIRLKNTLVRVPFDWKRLSRYAFWTAIVCLVIAIGNFLSDTFFVEYIIQLFNLSGLGRIGLPLVAAVIFYYWGFRRQSLQQQWHYSTEFILFLGVLLTAVAIWQLGVLLDNGSGHVAPLFLIGCIIYAIVGFFSRSSLVWLFALLALGNWFGAETGYISGWGAYWLGMNYPIRFVLFGSILLLLCYFLRGLLLRRRLFTMTKIMGLLYLFIALWIMSIYGNYDEDSWYSTGRLQILPWAILFAVAAIVCIYISLKTDDGILRGFGLTFLGINLYTRFFEYFWDSLHAGLFFLILAVSLVFIGLKAEKIWHSIEFNDLQKKGNHR